MKGFKKNRRMGSKGGKIKIPKGSIEISKGIRQIVRSIGLLGASRFGKLGFQIGLFTVIFALAAVGLVELVEGRAMGSDQRLGFYVLFSSILFIFTIYSIEKAKRRDGFDVMKVVIAITIVGFIIASLSGEGLIRVVQGAGYTSQTYVYLITGGLVFSGVSYWAIRHWKEYT